jgi:hypothetical protein
LWQCWSETNIIVATSGRKVEAAGATHKRRAAVVEAAVKRVKHLIFSFSLTFFVTRMIFFAIWKKNMKQL